MLRVRHERQRRRPWYLQFLLLLSVTVAYTVFWYARLPGTSGRVAPSAALPPNSVCSKRLATLGLWLPAPDGALRLNAAAAVQLSAGTLARRRLYESMAGQLSRDGLQVGKLATQGLPQSSIFRIEGDKVTPILRALDVPVRAIVAPFPDAHASRLLSQAVKRWLLPLQPAGGVWLQNDAMYHATIWHASHHQNPVKATADEVAVEAAAVEAAAGAVCPMHVALERVIATSSGNIVACWQLVTGGEPQALRQALAARLPNAPKAVLQAVRQPAILHTTLARLLKPPRGSSRAAVQRLKEAVAAMTRELCGLETNLREVWYIQEQHLLALALNGAYSKERAQLICPPMV